MPCPLESGRELAEERDDVSDLVGVLQAEGRPEHVFEWRRRHLCRPRGDPGRGAHQRASPIGRVGLGQQRAAVAKPRDGGGHQALRQARAGHHLGDRGAGMVADVDEHQLHAARKPVDAGARRGFLPEPHQSTAEDVEVEPIHIGNDASVSMQSSARRRCVG
jgi:hypothetical protein